MKKRILSVLLAFAMIFTLMPTALAAPETSVPSAIVLTAPDSTTVAVPKMDTPANEIDLPTAVLHDQHGKPMSVPSPYFIYYEIEGEPDGVTVKSSAGKIRVSQNAQAGQIKVVAKLAGTKLKSDPVTYTITRETSKVTAVYLPILYWHRPVPEVIEPGTPNYSYETISYSVEDQYGQEMTGQTLTWNVADADGKPVTGVSIDNTGKLAISNEAPDITVYVTATCEGIKSTRKLSITLHRSESKNTFVEICDQVGEAPETILQIPTGTVTKNVDYTAKVYDQYGKETAGMVFWELDKTYPGVELDAPTTGPKAGIATLKVEKTAESGTIKLIATCSTPGSTASKTLDITLTSKTVDITSLKVTQADTTYGTALADPVFTKPEGTNKTTIHYSTPTSSAYSSASKPTDAGNYVVNVLCETATHIYMGHANFKINPKSISNMLQPITGTYEYDGTPQNPPAVVKDGEVTLTEGKDYTVNYGTNINVFEAATVYVDGIGNYTGSFSRNFKIRPKPIDISSVSAVDRYYEEGRLDVDCTVTLSGAPDVKQDEHYLVFAAMADDTAGSDKTVNVLVKMVKGDLGENYKLNKDTTTWADSTTDNKTYTFTIKQATPAGEPAYTKITTSGKKLADAGLTTAGSTLNPTAGKLEWVDDAGNVLPDTTTVAANTTYKWRFTPDDTNYEVLTSSIELYHKSSSTGTDVTTYPITVKNAKNGDVTASHKSASKGDTVTITVKPDKGYVLDTLTVLDGKDKEIRLTEKKGKYSFTMPAGKVTVEAMFEIEQPTVENPFTDVPAGSYYEDAVIWAVDKGITTGTGASAFDPDGICTRAQIVTFLWRAAGSPAAKSGAMPFTDVKAGSYYYDAVLWAVEQGITKGTGDTMFSPDATCTRAQNVTFLWRANGSPAASGNSAFTDVAADAYYAAAVAWAEKNGITGGIGGGLFGSDNNCTRAQIVTFIYRSVK